MRTSISLPLAFLASFALQATAQNATANLLETLDGDSRFTSFYSYLNQVGLLSTLRDYPSNLTVVAPTNAAFQALQQSYLGNDLFEGPTYIPRNVAQFKAYMQYHFVQGSKPDHANTTDIGNFYPTLLANNTDWVLINGGQWVTYRKGESDDVSSWYSADNLQSNVTNSTIPYDQGTIYPVNKVLLPPFTVSETALDIGLHSFVGALAATDLTVTIDTLTNDSPNNHPISGITVLAPLDSAFSSVGSVLDSLNASALSDILKFHVITRRILVTPVIGRDIHAVTDSGAEFFSNHYLFRTLYDETNPTINSTVVFETGVTFMNSARVVSANIPIKNGVMHVIDQVLNPYNTTSINDTAGNGTVAYASATSVTSTPYATYPADPAYTSAALIPAATGGAAVGLAGHMGKGGLAGSLALAGGVAAAVLII